MVTYEDTTGSRESRVAEGDIEELDNGDSDIVTGSTSTSAWGTSVDGRRGGVLAPSEESGGDNGATGLVVESCRVSKS